MTKRRRWILLGFLLASVIAWLLGDEMIRLTIAWLWLFAGLSRL